MSGNAAKGKQRRSWRCFPFFIIGGACRKAPVSWEFFLADAAGNRLGTSLSAGRPARAVYRRYEPFQDQIAFQFFFRNEIGVWGGDWEVLSLVIEKPETPALEVASDLHAEDLAPGSYLVVLIRNDEELSKLFFTIAPPASSAKTPKVSEAYR